MKNRIRADDKPISMIFKLTEGNMGAITVLKEMMEKGAAIDPDSFAGPFSGLLDLDTNRIYGADIYKLHQQICGGDIVKTLAVLRAAQLGITSATAIHGALQGGEFKLDVVYARLQKVLPRFGDAEIEPAVNLSI